MTSRWFYPSLLIGVFFLVYAPSLSFGYIRLDDFWLLESNTRLGHWSLSGLRWALTTTEIDDRYHPVWWVVAWLGGGQSAFGYHVLTLVEGAVFSASLYHLLRRWASPFQSALCVGWLVLSLNSLEIFEWALGFGYLTVGLLLVWALLAEGWVSLLLVCLSLLAYPQAVCFGLLVVWDRCPDLLRRGVYVGFVGLFVFMQYRLRYTGRFAKDVDPNWCLWYGAVGHYAVQLLVPYAVNPLYPPLPDWSLGPGLLILGGCAAQWWPITWRVLFVLLPTLAASVTEPFTFGTRYLFLPSICLLWCLLRGRKPSKSGGWSAALGAAVILLSMVLVESNHVFADGRRGVFRSLEHSLEVGAIDGRLAPKIEEWARAGSGH